MLAVYVIIVGFVMAAFFSGSEIALISINWIRLEHWLEGGRRGAKALESFVADPQKVLGTTLVGTNIAVIMTSSLVAWKLSRIVPGPPAVAAVIATITVTPTLLIVSEIIPKMIGRSYSDALTLRIVHPLRVFYFLLSPIIVVASGAAQGILRLLGAKAVKWRQRLTKEQLRLLLTREGEKAGAVDSEEQRLISGVFEFAGTTVGEAMVPRTSIVGITRGTTVGEAADLVREHGFSRLPVFSDDRESVVGMVHSRDLLGLDRDEGIANLLRQLPHVPETKRCDDFFRELQARRQHMAVVVDEHGSLAGIVTLEDLIEELLGEIEDEYDVRRAPIQKVDDGLLLIDGRAEIDAVEEALGVSLPAGDYNTMAGLVLKAFGRIPEPGDEVVIDGIEVRVISASPTKIGKMRVRKRWTTPRSSRA